VVNTVTPLSFIVSLAGKEDAVRIGLSQALAELSPLDLNTDEAGTVELILAEALNNIIEHALAATHGETTIEIHANHDAHGLRLAVVDQGAPMPASKTPDGRAPSLDVATLDMPEGGFGWFMIHTLAQDVQYSRIGTTNHLSLLLHVGLENAV
jgi:serine/threonine-protein kinase RsbW